ncbi:MAG: ribulose-phosphate 3-epimerase [Candidatus Doudnabacteria bacterium]|nr:ribulose-phosphate 3-epimerase [Candidatus Doudnabacteria bacterium]
MLPKIIPAIIAKNFNELQKKIRQIEGLVDWAQIDVMDGKFVPNVTWDNPVELRNLKTALKLEAHLMVERPEKEIGQWLASGVKRILLHYESTKKLKDLIDKIKSAGIQVGIVLNPDTPASVLDEYIDQIDAVMFMAVHPGFYGEKFLPEAMDKIKAFHKKYPRMPIAVDGGMNADTIALAIQAGAGWIVAGSAIFKSGNAAEAILKVRKVIKSIKSGKS